MTELVTGSLTGAAIYVGLSRGIIIRPPFPLNEQFISPGCDTAPLRSLLEHRYTVALLLVRLGSFAIGVWENDRLLASKTGTGLVHGRHRKGGSSQRRFERHREKQVDVFLERVCGHARKQLGPYADNIDYFAYGGAWNTIASLENECPFLRRFEDRLLPPLLDIPNPRRSVLETAIADVLSSHVTEWSSITPGDIDTPQSSL